MATFNGENYIIPQLESLRNQTRGLDEVLICDDVSTDNTVGLIQSYIQDNNLKNWQLIVNKKNKGWRDNFIDLLNQSTADIIFTCDRSHRISHILK